MHGCYEVKHVQSVCVCVCALGPDGAWGSVVFNSPRLSLCRGAPSSRLHIPLLGKRAVLIVTCQGRKDTMLRVPAI